MPNQDQVDNLRDMTLTCVGCRAQFTWTAQQQRDDVLRDWWPKRSRTRPPPRRCPDCRVVQKLIHVRCPACQEDRPEMITWDEALQRHRCSQCGQVFAVRPAQQGR